MTQSGARGERALKAEMAMAFCMLNLGVSQTLLFAVLPAVGRALDLRDIEVASIISFMNAVAIVASPIWGRRSDRTGRKPLVMAGLYGIAISSLALAGVIKLALAGAFGATFAFLAMLAARGGAAVFTSAILPGVNALVADTTSRGDRAAGIARIASAYFAGTILGPGAAAALVAFDVTAPLLASGLLAFLAIVIAVRWVPAVTPLSRRAGKAPLRLTDRRVRHFLVLQAVISVTLAQNQQLGGFLLEDRFGLTPTRAIEAIGIAFVVMAAAAMVSQLYFVNARRLGLRMLLCAGFALILASQTMMPVAPSLWTALGAYLALGLGMGMAGPAISAGASLALGQDEQGALAGLQNSITAASYIAAPLLGALLYGISPALPYGASILFAAAATVYCLSGTASAPSPFTAASGFRFKRAQKVELSADIDPPAF